MYKHADFHGIKLHTCVSLREVDSLHAEHAC